MTEAILDKISKQLALLTQLVAIGLCDGKNRQSQIEVLTTAGMQPKEIGDLLKITPNSVSVALYQKKKTKATKKKATKKSAKFEVAEETLNDAVE